MHRRVTTDVTTTIANIFTTFMVNGQPGVGPRVRRWFSSLRKNKHHSLASRESTIKKIITIYYNIIIAIICFFTRLSSNAADLRTRTTLVVRYTRIIIILSEYDIIYPKVWLANVEQKVKTVALFNSYYLHRKL